MNRVLRFGGFALAMVAAMLALGLFIGGDGGHSTQGQTISGGLSAASELPIKGQLGACLSATNVAWGFGDSSKQWSSFAPNLPDALQGITQLVPGGGYFLNTSADCMIDSGQNHVSTYSGWNLFGWR